MRQRSGLCLFVLVSLVPSNVLKGSFYHWHAENTRKVALNLNYRSRQASADLIKSYVDVLVPEVLQVIVLFVLLELCI